MTSTPPLLDWSPNGDPRSQLYGDVYFSAEDGLAEARTVFLEGCNLPSAWADRAHFVVGELGFGTGLNILALLDLWRIERPAHGYLSVFSVEAHLMTQAEAARALSRWPELSDLADILLGQWPEICNGRHRFDLPDLNAHLDLALMDAEAALAGWQGRADAWFLDGFSPAKNPAMWRDDLLSLVGQRTAPGGQAATFTVAGQVRRGLQAAGFAVEKHPGFGRKRQRLVAVYPGRPTEPVALPRIAVVGAGIAGAAVSRALTALGAPHQVFDGVGPGAAASGNPAALVTPRLDAGLGPVARLTTQAFFRARDLYRATPGAVLAQGVLQLAVGERDAARFEKIVASDFFSPDDIDILSADEASQRLGEASSHTGLNLAGALVVQPKHVLAAWLSGVQRVRVSALVSDATDWRLLDDDGALIGVFDLVVLAGGQDSLSLAPHLDLRPVRGQATFLETDEPVQASAWGGYLIPTAKGLLFGATHDRGDGRSDLRSGDQTRNLETLALARPGLATRLSGLDLENRAAVRATTADSLPLAGPSALPGLFLLCGLGSHGFSFAPVMGEHVAALITGTPSPLSVESADLIDPDRFRRRAARRTRTSSYSDRASS
ncbi:MAG: FAD-dependent cmnm(5)s(2)U34 oxidoreductase [Phenylobacterium zucineum]|nr:MAG: FAD-dependent cmnm(5)s(2)U34 oxidoreductase [Phenylobacterium zucineum]